jgi:putative membrane protein
MLLFAGLVAGSAMILPGLSGGYLFLVLGQYVTILGAIGAARVAATARDWAALVDPLHVLVPVGLGAMVGVVGVSNLVKLLLERFPRPTLGVLLGLLLGAVIGLWPFVHPVEPAPGAVLERGQLATLDGELIFVETGRPVEVRHWPIERFRPTFGQVAGSLGLVALGLGASLGVSHLGAGRR